MDNFDDSHPLSLSNPSDRLIYYRDAVASAPSFGDRRCYQLPPMARGLARRAIIRDVNEGADIIMVKPMLPYLDVIGDARELAPNHPLAAYQVSGEFAMLHAGAKAGIYELRRMAEETAMSAVRAGATLILTYFTPDFLEVSYVLGKEWDFRCEVPFVPRLRRIWLTNDFFLFPPALLVISSLLALFQFFEFASQTVA